MNTSHLPVNSEAGTAGGYPRTRTGIFAALTGFALWLAWVRYGRFLPTIDRLAIFGLAAVSLPLAAWILDRILYRAPRHRSVWIQDIPFAYWLRSLLIVLWLAIALIFLPMVERDQAVTSYIEHFGPVEQRYFPQPWWYQWLPTATMPPRYEIQHASLLATNQPLKDPGLLAQLVYRMGVPMLFIEQWPGNQLVDLPRLRGLKHLHLAAPRKIETLDGLEHQDQLEGFSLSQAERLHDVSALARLSRLRVLSLSNSPIANLTPVGSLRLLRELRLGSLPGEASLSPVASCSRLEKLEIIWQWKLGTFDGLDQLTGLRALTLHGVPELEHLPNLQTLSRLEKLRVVMCKNLVSLEGLEQCKSLRRLELDDNERLQKIDALAELSSLEDVSVERCERVSLDQWNAMLQKHGLIYRGKNGNSMVWARPASKK